MFQQESKFINLLSFAVDSSTVYTFDMNAMGTEILF